MNTNLDTTNQPCGPVNVGRRLLVQGALAALGSSLVAPSLAAASPAGPIDWRKVRASYSPQHPNMNLNNAAVSPAPIVVQEVVISAYRMANGEPDVNMWDTLDAALPSIKRKLSVLADCDVSEIAINRNSTEGLCTAIFGISLRTSDEVLLSIWDYASMRAAWQQRVSREGVVIRPVTFDLMDSEDAIVQAYQQAITPKTKVMHLTHMVHWTGRVLPVQRLCAMASSHGIYTVVDAAQSFAHIPLSFKAINCDYLATSLHKWLCAPLGTGMLLVKSSRIDETWPLLAPFDERPLGIEKFGHWNLGTYCSPLEAGIGAAIDFHNTLGTERIHGRLQSLSRYWVDKAASSIKGFHIHTPMDSPELGAVTLFSVDGVDPEYIEKQLRQKVKIRVRFRKQASLYGVRVSPHIYTLESELDRFVDALRQICRNA